jgi:Spy/CpxP family protein refolding chaperone
MLMQSLSRHALLLSLALAAPALGCGGGVASEPVTTAESATTRAPVAQSSRGPLRIVGDALGQVPLTASQRTQIEKLAADAEARHVESHAARKDLMLAVADQVQAGRIDRAALQPRIDALAAALGKAQPADRASFEQLHALLSTEQRATFVDAIEARVDGHGDWTHRRQAMKQWADDLKLTEDQKAQIRSALRARFHASDADHGVREPSEHGGEHPWAEAGRHGAKVLAAFKQDRFVMDEVAPPRDLTQAAAKMSEHLLGVADTVLPLLTPEQRTIAAQKIREKAAAGEDVGPAF